MIRLTEFLHFTFIAAQKNTRQYKDRWVRAGLAFLACFLLAVSAVAQSGTVKPKYIVVSVIYAPPGQLSSVDYGNSTVMGTATKFDHSFAQGTTITTSVQAGPIGGGSSQSFTQTSTNTSSIAINKTTTSDIVVPGPANSFQGIDHDYDVILLWINPVINLTVTGTDSAQWTGFSFDSNDPANEVDVVPVYVAWLKDPSKMPPGVSAALARSWAAASADGSGPGLTQSDFNTILARDPFANGSTNIDPARFQLTGETLSYAPPPNGGQAIAETFALTYGTTATESSQATDEYKTTYSVDVSASIFGFLTAHFIDTHTFDFINSVTQTTTDTSGQKATLFLKSPDAGYTGPTDLRVYRDNIYGTFMFSFVPATPPGFFLSVAPVSQNIAFGGSATFTVSATALNSFSGSIDLSVSGLPSGCGPATFSPASITPPGSSTMTIPNCATAGNYVSFVVGTSGALPQASTAFGLSVGQPPLQTGTGCSVAFNLNPVSPVEGQTLTVTGTLQGIVPGNTGVGPISLDHQQFCAASTSGPCVASTSSLLAGAHELEWTCTSTGPGGNGTGSGSLGFTVQSGAAPQNWAINPKFVVLSVIYAPPGQTSTVDYNASEMLGTKTSLDKFLSDNTTVSLAVGAGVSIFPQIKGGLTVGATVKGSKSFTQSADNTSSVDIKKTTSNDVLVPGPANSIDGIDHNFDVILVWINPSINLTITGTNSVQWSGYSFDAKDPANEVDVVPLYVAWLKDSSTMPPGIAAALARTWADPPADGLGPALNSNDFAQILARDPFADPAYAPTLIPGKTTTTDKRFDLVIGNTLAYEPAPGGGQPLTQKASLAYELTQVDGLTVTDQYDVSYSLDVSANLSIPVANWIAVNFSTQATASNKLTLKSAVSQETTNTTTQTASLSLTGPSSAYTGPTDLQVFKDNVYGTFMFSFNPGTQAPDFFLFTPSGSQTVGLGGSTSYEVDALAFNNFSGNIALSVSGLPAGVTASFLPSSITGTNFSILTVNASAATVPGSYTLTITGTGPGAITDSVTVELIVSAATFSLAASPASQTVIAGQSTSYALSVDAIAGFNGNVSLSAAPLPAGVTASFSPSSISVSGTSVLMLNVSPATAAGNYAISITGTSGSLTQTATIQLSVTASPFILSASPRSQPVIAGQSTVFRIASTPLAGFTGTAALNIGGLPTGVTATFDSPAITGAGVANLTVNTSLSTPPGGYSLTVTGTVGSLPSASTVINLLVTEPITQTGTGCSVDFALNPLTPLPGQPATVTGTVQGIAPGNTVVAPIALDNQQLCAATESTPCVATINLPAGIHSLRFSCTSTGPGGNGTGSANQLFAVGSEGSISPKYEVLSVIYAPPGALSTVDYNSSTMLGTTTSLTNSFSLQTSLDSTLSFGRKYSVPNNKKALSGGFTITAEGTSAFTQGLATSDSITLNKTTSTDIVVPGPKDLVSGSSAGINHDYDVVLLWLNPVANLVVTETNSALWTGYRFDPDDPVNEMDVVPVYVAWLKNPSLMPPGVAFALARTWAPEPIDGSGTGLTTADYAAILQRDPFANGSQSIDPARFVLSGETFAFSPPPNGGQPFKEKMSLSYQTQTQQTHTETDQYEVAYTTKSSNSNVDTFLSNNLNVEQTNSSSKTRKQTLTLTNSSTLQGTQVNGQQATLSLVGPTTWAGPTDLQVYQDNVYGTFMFAFVPETTFRISADAPSQTVSAGGNAIFPVSANVLSGANETIVFSTSGLPPTATATFTPASITGSGSSTLTVGTSASTPTGIYPFTIIGTVTVAGVTETHVANATLIVAPATGFLFTASPAVQTTPAGQSTTYQVSTSAIAGFSGTVTLGVTQLPPGATATFNPPSITGSGSSTLTITTTAFTTLPGSYALTITGTSGVLPQATTNVGLFVYAPFTSSGSGCSVGFAFNPSSPTAGQPLTVTGTLSLAAGNTGSAAISLDHQQFCSATQSAPCVASTSSLTAGTHELEWSCSSNGSAGAGSGSGSQLFTTSSAPPDGSVNPKYVVLSVIYTPPGRSSTVDYGSSTVLGTNSSIKNSFKTNTGLTVTIGSKTLGANFTQTTDNQASIDVKKTNTFDIQVPGLANPTDGIDHDFDVILLWINPVMNLTVTDSGTPQVPGSAEIPSLAFDPNDPANEVDVVPVYVSWLKHPETMPDGIKNALARTWALPLSDRSSPAITAADFPDILKADPFTNSNYVLTLAPGTNTTADNRFDLEAGGTFAYEPPPSGGQPITQRFSLQYQATSTQGQSAQDEHTTGFNSNQSIKLSQFLTSSLTTANSWTWTNKVASGSSSSTGQTASLSLSGPCAGYNGPTDVQIYQDNVYGTFMFAFVNGTQSPDFSLCAEPTPLTVNTGSSGSYTVSTSPSNGFSGAVSLSVSGLPAGVTATFNPASITGAGTSKMTVNISASAAAGTYVLTITGTSGSLTHITTVTLVVKAVPVFALSATPATQTVVIGGTATYSVSSTALNGLTGDVALTLTGLPAGTTASFSPSTITGSTGTSTLTITTSGTTPVADSTLTITGTNGSVVQTFGVILKVTDFTLTVTPATQQVVVGASTTYTVSTTALNGFNGTVTPTVTGLPAGATATFSPTTITGAGTATLTVTTSGTTPAANATLTITGSSGTLAHTATVTLNVANFTIAVTPSTQTVVAGGSTTYTVTTTAVNGFSGTVTPTISGLPAGATASFSPATITGAGTSTITVTTTSATPGANSTLTVTGTSGTISKTATATLTVRNFTLTATPSSQTVIAGASTTYTVTVAAVNGFTGTVTPSVSGLPTGATASFSPATVTGGAGTTTMTVTTTASTPGGTSTLTVTGTSGTAVHTATVTLGVRNFTFTATPSSQTVLIGGSVTYTVNSAAVNGLTGNVALTVTGLPTGATASFSPSTITSSTGTSTLTVTTASTTPAANSTLTIKGTNGSLVHTVPVTLSVVDFTVAVTPSTQTVVAGGSTTYTVTTTALNGFSGTVTPTVSGLPAGATASFSPATITGAGTSTMTVTTTSATPGANSTLTVTGTSGARSKTATATLTVRNFTLSATPSSQTVTAGASTTYTVTVAAVNGFTGTVTPSVSGLPAGATASFSPATITGGAGTTTMTVSTTAATPGANSTLTITGTSGTAVHTATVTLGVRNFTFTASPASQSVVVGGSVTYTVTSTAVNGLTGDVALTVTGLPTGATASFSPATITGSTGTSTLTVTTSGATPAANSTLTITGTNGTLAQTAPVTLSVTDFGVAVTPSTQVILAGGGSTTYTVTITALNGFSGTVTPSVSGLPTGVTASFSPATITGGAGTTTMTVTTTAATPAANSTLTVTGTSGSRSNTGTATLAVQDFTVTATPATQTITAGGSTTYTVTVAAVNGFTGTVTPSVSGLPAGATASFSPATITGGAGTTTLTVSATSGTPGGNSTLTVTGSSGSVSHSASVTLAVTNFTLTATPATQSVLPGGSVTYTVTSTAVNGLAGNVALTIAGLPTGATASFSPATITGSTGSSTLTVTTSGTTPAANSTLTISGANGTLTQTTSVTLSVVDFNITVTPSAQTVAAGGSTTYTVTTTALNGFSGTVTPTVTGLPTGATASFSPATITGAGTSTMTVATSAATPAANSTLTVTGTSGGRVKSAAVTLSVTDFSIAVSPASQTVTAGGSTSYTVTVTALNGFTGSVPLSSSGLPAGATATFSPATITGAGTSTMTVSTTGATPTGTTSFTVTGNSAGTPAHSTTASLTIIPNLVILRPTVDTQVGDAPYTNPANAQDGDPATFASGTPAGAQGRGGEIWSGFGAGTSPRTTVSLKITSGGNCGFAQAEGFAVDYSLDGGATWTTIYSMGVYGGVCTSLAQHTDVISLSVAQNLTQVQVRARFASFGNTSHQMYDAWIEVQ